MTTQDDLRAAAERLKADDDSSYVEMVKSAYPAWKAFSPRQTAVMCDSLRDKDKQVLVDAYLATLDERPVTVEALVERGFVATNSHYGWFHWNERVWVKTDSRVDAKDWYWEDRSEVEINPPPQNMGDVSTLLSRLARG